MSKKQRSGARLKKYKKGKRRGIKTSLKKTREFIKLEKRLRHITTDNERKVGRFLRANSRELAKKTNEVLEKV